jgi:hypothetical protein
MPGVDALWESVFEQLVALKGAWPSTDWGYDRRFKCVMSTITLAQQVAARAAMATVLPQSFTAESLPTGPPSVRALAAEYGGVRSGQMLLWGASATGPGAFGLWWPWGDGKSVSLRVGLHDVDAPKQRYPRLRDIFGIPQSPQASPG